MLVDNVQMGLHSGVPAYNDDTAAYVDAFGHNMSQALLGTVASKAGAGFFAANCFSHGSFYSSQV